MPASTAASPTTRSGVTGSPTSTAATSAAVTGLTVIALATRVGLACRSATTHSRKASAPPTAPR